ncbi:MAG: hypothetical protein LBS03_04975 [Bacteroidales bacterium]|jgi:hypothetical protein|nr:hypothetical protein [Bacteroidales bacterium]
MNEFISPAGMRMLGMVVIVAIVAGILYVRYIYRRAKRKTLRIREKMWYSGGLKMSVNIWNKSRNIVEFTPPTLEFRRPRMKKRRFRIIPSGDKNIFPLGLSPQTGYDFQVDFILLYDREPLLRQYEHLVICVDDKSGKQLVRKKVRLKRPPRSPAFSSRTSNTGSRKR